LRRCSPGRCWRCADILFGAATRIEAGRLGAWRSERPTYQGDRGSADRQRIGQRPSNRSPICVTLGRGSRRPTRTRSGSGVPERPFANRASPAHTLPMDAGPDGRHWRSTVGSCSPHEDLRLQSDELSKCRPPVRTALVRSSLERLVPAPYWNVASGGRIFLALAVRGPTRHQPRADRRSSDRPPVDRRPPRRSTFSLNGRPLPLSSRVDWVGSTRYATSSPLCPPHVQSNPLTSPHACGEVLKSLASLPLPAEHYQRRIKAFSTWRQLRSRPSREGERVSRCWCGAQRLTTTPRTALGSPNAGELGRRRSQWLTLRRPLTGRRRTQCRGPLTWDRDIAGPDAGVWEWTVAPREYPL
jgi:hypothetical protein